MAISLASLKKTAPKANPFILLYGVEGVGKDTLAAEFPEPVLIPTAGETPPKGVDIFTFPEVTTFDDLVGAVQSLIIEEHSFRTVIISALDGVERLVWAETCRRNEWQTLEEPGYGKGYLAADAVWQELLEGLNIARSERGLTVILIGHTEIKTFDDPASTSYSRYQPNLHKRAADIVKAGADVIAFLNYRVSIKTEKTGFGQEKTSAGGAGLRIIYLEERPGFIAKNRYDMPSEVNFKKGQGYSALVKAGLPAEVAA